MGLFHYSDRIVNLVAIQRIVGGNRKGLQSTSELDFRICDQCDSLTIRFAMKSQSHK